jgi:nitrogen fixation protein FixH
MNRFKQTANLWPYGIVVAFGLFIGGLATLIAFAARQPAELVAPDYYEQELRYQDQLDSQTRAGALSAPLRVEADPARHRILLTFPADHIRQGVAGTVRLYRPAAADLDRTELLAPGPEGSQAVNIAGLPPGLWHLRVDWRSADHDYSVTERITLPRLNP